MFETKTAATEGPVTDRWGTWFSGLAPVIDDSTGKLIGVLGVDVDVRDWEASTTRLRRLGIAASAVVALIVILSTLLILRQHRLSVKLAIANRIVENSTAILYRLSGAPSPVLIFISSNISRLGYEPKELLGGRTYLELVHPEDRASVEAVLQRMLEGDDISESSSFGFAPRTVLIGGLTTR